MTGHVNGQCTEFAVETSVDLLITLTGFGEDEIMKIVSNWTGMYVNLD